MKLTTLALILGIATMQGAQPVSRPIAIVNVTVLPMDSDRVLPGQTVLVQRGVIAQVGPRDKVTLPAGALRIDGSGRYLMPGLADLHVHMAGPRAIQEELLKMYVVAGVTTILNMRGTPDHLTLRSD